jgi:hypothetical protein
LSEVNHEDLVVRIAGAHEIQYRLIDLPTLVSHGARVVDHNAQFHGNVLAAK